MDVAHRCTREIEREFPPEPPGVLFEVADVFRKYGPAYRAAHRLSLPQRKAMGAIEKCRTSALGGHVAACDR
jgi:hypothetical protein